MGGIRGFVRWCTVLLVRRERCRLSFSSFVLLFRCCRPAQLQMWPAALETYCKHFFRSHGVPDYLECMRLSLRLLKNRDLMKMIPCPQLFLIEGMFVAGGSGVGEMMYRVACQSGALPFVLLTPQLHSRRTSCARLGFSGKRAARGLNAAHPWRAIPRKLLGSLYSLSSSPCASTLR